MLSEFISDFRNTKYFKQILEDNKVILLYLSGSRILNITDERSDYDLVAVVDGVQDSESDCILTYEGKRVHWYLRPVSEFICGYGKGLNSCGAVLFGMINNGNIIYANPSYDALCNVILSNRKFIAWNGAHYVVKRYEKLIESVLRAGAVLPENYTKILSHLCIASCFVYNQQLTDKEKQFLSQIKRIRWQPVSDEAKAWCFEKISALKMWFDSNPLRQFLEEEGIWTNLSN